ncbi:hypothetical protein KIN20_026514 [Parelaphostrongylus tenuis]|uniref:Uncharacterized protein n=1 Tax=Parelaphostrongylus tenuis TaxID=148309 RepID=A0AAD5WCW0_PARTN|nr:hypothetical protein KIN20_026514 [Parelaphostrongylus tenuis]
MLSACGGTLALCKQEGDSLDSDTPPTRRRRVDRSSIHLRSSDRRSGICYNLFCPNANECTCEPVVVSNSPVIAIDD